MNALRVQLTNFTRMPYICRTIYFQVRTQAWQGLALPHNGCRAYDAGRLRRITVKNMVLLVKYVGTITTALYAGSSLVNSALLSRKAKLQQ